MGFSALCLLVATLPGYLAAQKKDKDPEKLENWKPEAIPAAAVKYAAAMEEQAPADFKQWAAAFATHEMRAKVFQPRDAMQVVDARYAKSADEPRDAATFLLYYVAYKQEDTSQVMLASEVREIDRETYDLSRQLKVISENERLKLPTRQDISMQERMRNDENVRKIDARIGELGERRLLRMKDLDAARKRINFYLKALAVTHPRMEGIPAESIRSLQ